MKKFIYLRKDKAKIGLSLVVACLDKRCENYKEEYGDNIIEYIGEDLPHYITYDELNDTIRESTEEEKLKRKQIMLKEDEVIINGNIYTINKDLQKVNNGKIISKTNQELFDDGVLSLEEIYKSKRDKIKKIRDELLHSPIKVKLKPYKTKKAVDVYFQVRENDLSKFRRIKDVVSTLNKLGISKQNVEKSINILRDFGLSDEVTNTVVEFIKTGALPWVLADNTTKIFEVDKLELVEVIFGIREQQLFSKFIKLDKKLISSKTVEEIEAIKWE